MVYSNIYYHAIHPLTWDEDIVGTANIILKMKLQKWGEIAHSPQIVVSSRKTK